MRTAISMVLVLLAANPEPRTRMFHFEYQATLMQIPEGAHRAELWIPVPQDDPYQTLRNLNIQSSQPYTVDKSTTGNLMAHISLDHPVPTRIRVSFDVARKEHRQQRLDREETTAALAAYLKPDRLVPLDPQIRKWATEVVTQAHATTDFEMARAIYNHIVATVKYDKTGKGWGRGDIYYACDARRGNCTDFHAIFIGYARALGIPARFAIGFPLPAERGEGKIAGYHCWAEFYAKGKGWIPIDASEATKNPDKREYYFGTHDENRVEFSKGRDLTLMPGQQAEALNYFIYPYLEIDGKPAETAPVLEVSYRDLK